MNNHVNSCLEEEAHGESDLLWSFEAVKTLPRPDFDVKAGHNWIRLRIEQARKKESQNIDLSQQILFTPTASCRCRVLPSLATQCLFRNQSPVWL
jgi:hypothetical protein